MNFHFPHFPHIKNLGINMARMLEFSMKYPGWHSFSNDKTTKTTVLRLTKRGLVEMNQFKQFRLAREVNN